MHKKSAQYVEITVGNHVWQKMDILSFYNQGSFTHGIKEILLSLQKEIANCLFKLELGWGNKGKETQLGQGMEEKESKEWASRGRLESGVGPDQPKQVLDPIDKPIRQQIINSYHKIYMH